MLFPIDPVNARYCYGEIVGHALLSPQYSSEDDWRRQQCYAYCVESTKLTGIANLLVVGAYC